MYRITLPGSRIAFRPTTEDDALLVTKWRNTPQARRSFFDTRVVTPDTHVMRVHNRKPHDLVWMIELKPHQDDGIWTPAPPVIGMLSLTVNVENRDAEYGRLFIDDAYQGQGLAKEAEYLMLWTAFELLRLDRVWLEAYDDNTAVLSLHRKTGFQMLPGTKLHEGRPVVTMAYTDEMWRQHRENFAKAYPVELPAWS